MDSKPETLLALARGGARLSDGQIRNLAAHASPQALSDCAVALTLEGHGRLVGHSRKVFIPVTRLCRNVCAYCTFATSPKAAPSPFLSPDEVLGIARAGAAAGCREALFTLGEKPELRYRAAREALEALGHASTVEYVAALAERVFRETGLLPHINAGNLDAAEFRLLRPHAASMGIMLETTAERLGLRGQAHWNCPDKQPEARLATLEAAGAAGVAMTSGLLIGIGETPMERVDALLALRAMHERHGHLQEIIVQNFRAKPRTPMASAPEPTLEEHAWTIAMARMVFGPQMSIQAPPNLRSGELRALIDAGVNDWGGISPVTIDHVNPEAAWPELERLDAETRHCDRLLVERLALAPSFARRAARWTEGEIRASVLRSTDAQGWVREDDWIAGTRMPPSTSIRRLANRAPQARPSAEVAAILRRATEGETLDEAAIARLFVARDEDFAAIAHAADTMRARLAGESVTYVRNCNINYTNICKHRCGFCAFAKSHAASALRGPAYKLDADAVVDRAHEAWERGAREVCMQGGIHPHYDGHTYLELTRAVKSAIPEMHIHAFSPLEILHGARSLGLPVDAYLGRLREAGLGSLPGTAAEVLDDEVRALICPDKLDTAEWLDVMRAAHLSGIRTTATIMFGHVDTPLHWARHLLHLRALQAETGGFTEFVPLPFVHMESPLWHKGKARSGPSLREAILMHAVPRLVFGALLPNVQTSWVKMGSEGATLCLRAGANDLGGTLMYESITRAAGGANGQLMNDEDLRAIAAAAGRPLRRRTTVYGHVDEEQAHRAPDAAALTVSAI